MEAFIFYCFLNFFKNAAFSVILLKQLLSFSNLAVVTLLFASIIPYISIV